MARTLPPRVLTCAIRREGEHDIVTLFDEDGSLATPPYRFEWSPDERLNATLRLLYTDEPPSDFANRLIELGQELYRALFGGAAFAVLERLDQGWANKQTLRLQMYVQSPELAYLPWEALHDGITLLSARSEFTLVRMVDPQRMIERIEVNGPLRILIASASPADRDALDTQKVIEQLKTWLDEPIHKKRRIILDELPNATIKELSQKLLQNYHVLCFAGHGDADALFLDDGQGDWDAKRNLRLSSDSNPLGAAELAQLLEGKTTQLVVLMACRTGSTPGSPDQPMVSYAENLVRQASLPAVIAMQTPISDLQANPFVAHFLTSLGAGHAVDTAVAEARKALSQQGRFGRDVIAPVLWLQARNGKLFQRRANTRSILLGMLAALLLIGAGLLLNQTTSENYARVLAYQAERELSGPFPERSVALALLSRREQPRLPEAEQALVQAVASSYAGWMRQGTFAIFSPDDAYVLSIGDDPAAAAPPGEAPALQIHDAATGAIVGHVPYTANEWGRAVFRPDSAEFAFVDGDTIIGWNSATTTEAFRLQVADPEFLIYSADSSKLLVIHEQSVTLWSRASLQRLLTIPVPDQRIRTAAYHPQLEQFATLSQDGVVTLWNGTNGEPLRTWQAFNTNSPLRLMPPFLHYSPDGRHLLTPGDSRSGGAAQIYDIATGEIVMSLSGSRGDFEAAAYSGDGRRLAVSSGTEALVWDLATQEVLLTVQGHRDKVFGASPSNISHVGLNRDGTRLLTSSYNSIVRVWEIDRPRTPIVVPANRPETMTFSPDGSRFAAYNGLLAIDIWDMSSGKRLNRIPTLFDLDAIAFSPDGARLAGSRSYDGSEQDETRVWDVATGRELFSSPHAAASLAFSPDGSLLLASTAFYSSMLDAETGSYLSHPGVRSIEKPQFSADGSALVAIRGTDLSFGLKQILGQSFLFPTDHQQLRNFALSADGRIIVTLGDGMIKVWDRASRQKIRQFSIGPGDQPAVGVCLTLSPDGKRVATHVDDQVRIWSVASGELLVRLIRPNTTLTCTAFSPDGRWIAAASNDDAIQIWPVWIEPLPLERYAAACCLIQPLDNSDFQQLTAIQPNLLRSAAGKLLPLYFIPGLVILYGYCWLLLNQAQRWGAAPTKRERAASFWRRLAIAIGRRLAFVGGTALVFGGITALLMAADPMVDVGALPLLIVLAPVSLTVGIAYYLLSYRRIRHFVWLRVLLGAVFWSSISSLLGSFFGAWVSSGYWAAAQPLTLGLFSELAQNSIRPNLSILAEPVLRLLAALMFSLVWTLVFATTSMFGALLALPVQPLRRIGQRIRKPSVTFSPSSAD